MTGGWSRVRTRSNGLFRKQLTAYVAWVNSQLKKKPGAHLVEDLRHDVRDGVALIDLIEVIAGERLADTHPAPSSTAEMVENVEAVLRFMALNKVKMHHITTRDVVEGNLKAIMRLVLALAAHYKPNSVRHSAQRETAVANQNITGIAQRETAVANQNITGIAQVANVVEGNLKAIMRLVLALAAHYKPNSVRHSAQRETAVANQNITGIAQVGAVQLDLN
ncbi:hypothetical protein EGW08_014035 [Elysia chlorotica]|uniref:Calponin-homology (CH) domain-containing protein n=1 Tax=Elysia chlorotica TaxID=188477 RepID=A0A3S1HFB9_ELYCH|nr:hypothetical protein EGW08_014035 [Elysia chlorotica]